MNANDYIYTSPERMTDLELERSISQYENVWKWCESNKLTSAQATVSRMLHPLKKERAARRNAYGEE